MSTHAALTADCARARVARVRHDMGGSPPPSLAALLREVIVIASSSRSGSSLVARLLQSVPGLLHFPGEINPYLRLARLTYPFTRGDSDRLEIDEVSGAAAHALDALLSEQCGQPARGLDGDDAIRRFAFDLTFRLTVQWPGLRFDPGEVQQWVSQTLADVGQGARTRFDAVAFHVVFLRHVRRRYPEVDPWRYDLPADPIARVHDVPCPFAGAPLHEGFEEPPFVTVGPWRSATAEQMASMPLVVKTPSNAYRLDALRGMFPNARMRVIHLTRHPCATVNGLYDGWRSRGFHAHRVDVALSMGEYVDALGDGARHWWKFDLPPGWRHQVDRPLLEVCAWQWAAAHEAVFGWIAARGADDVLRLSFDSLIGAQSQRDSVLRALERWLGCPVRVPLQALFRRGLPPIMVTVPPREDRWRERGAAIRRALDTPRARQLTKALGHDLDTAPGA